MHECCCSIRLERQSGIISTTDYFPSFVSFLTPSIFFSTLTGLLTVISPSFPKQKEHPHNAATNKSMTFFVFLFLSIFSPSLAPGSCPSSFFHSTWLVPIFSSQSTLQHVPLEVGGGEFRDNLEMGGGRKCSPQLKFERSLPSTSQGREMDRE